MSFSSEPIALLFVRLAAIGVDDPDLRYRLTLIGLAAFSAIWITALGASVGSFLNVVIYRLPLGMSLVRPKSRCPACGTSIRPGDNVPILGWMRLRGRCRACGRPISPRYPLVEAMTAILFLGLAHFELLSGGANLPGSRGPADDLGFVLWNVRPALAGLFAYHATLLCGLFCLSLIAWDGLPPPRRLVVFLGLIGLLVPVALPSARPVASGLEVLERVPAWPVVETTGFSLAISPAAIAAGLIGLAAGAAVGGLVSPGIPRGPQWRADRRGALAVGGLIGLFLGWQAAISCGVIAAGFAVANAAASWVVARSLPMTALLAGAVVFQIPMWRVLARLEAWPGPTGWNALRRIGWPEPGFAASSLLAAAIAAAAIAWIAGRIARQRSSLPETTPSRVGENPNIPTSV